MRRLRAGFAEIVQRLDDASPEVMFPQAIDQYASSQWMIRFREPAGEGETAAGLPGAWPRWLHLERRLAVSQHGRYAGADQPAGTQIIAAAQYIRRRWLATVP